MNELNFQKEENEITVLHIGDVHTISPFKLRTIWFYNTLADRLNSNDLMPLNILSRLHEHESTE